MKKSQGKQGGYINGKPVVVKSSAPLHPAKAVTKQMMLPTRSPVKGK